MSNTPSSEKQGTFGFADEPLALNETTTAEGEGKTQDTEIDSQWTESTQPFFPVRRRARREITQTLEGQK